MAVRDSHFVPAAPRPRVRAAPVVAAAIAIVAQLTCSDATGPRAPAVASLALGRDSAVVSIGGTLRIDAVPLAADGRILGDRPVTWSIADPAVASVSPSGDIRGLTAGRTILTARAGLVGRNIPLIVRLAATATVLAGAPDTLDALGATAPLAASSTGDGQPVAGRYAWFSGDTTVVRVTQAGVVVAAGDGAAWVVAREDAGSRDSARIVVRQRPVRIVVPAATPAVAVGRTLRLAPVALDPGGAAVANPAFRWFASALGRFAVDTNGVVAGLVAGSDTVRIGAGAVTLAVPILVLPRLKLRFSRDTFEVGAGQFPSDPRPHLGADSVDYDLPVTLAIADTTVATGPTSFPMGSIGATLLFHGLRPGRTQAVASAAGYLPDTAVVLVSTPRTRVVTSDSGGLSAQLTRQAGFSLQITDSSGSMGHALAYTRFSVRSSDTTLLAVLDSAVVLANDVGGGIVTTPLAAGWARVIVTAPGYAPDTSPLIRITPPRVRLTTQIIAFYSPPVIGVGQSGGVVSLFALPGAAPGGAGSLTVVQRHPERLRLTAQTGLPFPDTHAFSWDGLATGVDTVIASAPGALPDTLIVHVTAPQLRVDSVPLTGRVTQAAGVSVSVADSAGGAHVPSTLSLRLRLRSTDSTVVRFANSTVVLGDSPGVPVSLRFTGAGSARLIIEDSAGLYPAWTSPLITVLPSPLSIAISGDTTHRLTLGTYQRLGTGVAEVRPIGGAAYSATPITLRSADPSIAAPVPSAVTAGAPAFDIVSYGTPGLARIIVGGPGWLDDTLLVTVGRPRLRLLSSSDAFVGEPTSAARVRLYDPLGVPRVTTRPIRVALSSSDPAIADADSGALDIPAGADESPPTALRYRGDGEAVIRVSDLAVDAAAAESGVGPLVTVRRPPLIGGRSIRGPGGSQTGVGQELRLYIGRPQSIVSAPVRITLRHTNAANIVPPLVTIPIGGNYTPYIFVGGALGEDTLIAESPGYVVDTTFVSVTPGSVLIPYLPAVMRLRDSALVFVGLTGADGSERRVASRTTFALTASEHLAFSDGRRGITSIAIAAHASSSPRFWVKAVQAGTASVSVTAPNYQPPYIGSVVVVP